MATQVLVRREGGGPVEGIAVQFAIRDADNGLPAGQVSAHRVSRSRSWSPAERAGARQRLHGLGRG